MEWLQSNIVSLAVLGGGVIGTWLAAKFIPGIVRKYVGGAIEDAYGRETGDPVEKELRDKAILANMAYLEYLNPDAGKGVDRKAYLVSKFGPKVGPLVEVLMDSLDDTMKDFLAKHKEPVS